MPLKLYLRNGIWNYRGTIGPTERRSRLRGTCKTSDRDIASRQIAEIEAKYWKGHFDGPASILTFERAASMYLEAGRSQRFVPRIREYFAGALVKDISPGKIRQMAIDLYPNCGGATRNRHGIVPAQAIINHAAEAELCSPIRVRRFRTETKVKAPVTLEWLEPFMEHASPVIGTLALFMFLTGARISEALAVEWEDINLNACTVLIRQSKVSSERVSHLPSRLVAAIANLPRIKGRPVFVYRRRADIQRAWFDPMKSAGIKRLSTHSCRHGFATGLLRKGVDVVTVAKLGGWRTPAQVLLTYGHAIDNNRLTDLLVDGKLTHADIKIAETLLKSGTT